jgi:RNA polymerase subunit RPABC4/transcription elongation factor Spt4
LYYLATGHYEEEGFSVRVGLPDFICMALNWFLLYHRFGSDPPAEKESEIALRNVNNATPQEPAPKDTHSPRCSACGSSLPPNAKFCPECGEKVLPPGMTICQECGELVDQGKFCTECGCKSATDILPNAETKNPPTPDSDLSGARVDSVGNIVPQKQPESDTRNSTELFLVGVIVFGVLAIFLALVYAIVSGAT